MKVQQTRNRENLIPKTLKASAKDVNSACLCDEQKRKKTEIFCFWPSSAANFHLQAFELNLGWKYSLHAGCLDCLHEFLDFFVPWIHASTSASLRACVSSIQAIVIRIVFIIVIMCCFSDNDHDYYIFYHCRLAPRVLG